MSEFEARPRRTRLEKLVSAMSIRTSPMEPSTGGSVAMEPGQWAATLSGMDGDAETALHYVLFLAGEPYHRKPLIARLMYYLSPRILMSMPTFSLTGTDLRDVVAVALDAERHGGTVTPSDAARGGIKRKRWERLKPVYQMTVERLDEVSDQVIRHLSRACS